MTLPKNVSQYFTFFAFVFLVNCSGEKETPILQTNDDPHEAAWIDSTLGKLTLKQKYYQHLIIEIPAIYQNGIDSLTTWISINQPGAIKFEEWNLDSIQRIKTALDSLPIIQPFIYANYFDLLHCEPYPFWDANNLNRNPELTNVFGKAGYGLINFQIPIILNKLNTDWLDSLSSTQSLCAIVNNFDDRNAAEQFDDFLTTLKSTNQSVFINLQQFDTVNFQEYRIKNQFDGLFIVKSKEILINSLIESGADFVFRKLESKETFKDWESKDLTVFDESTKRILSKKATRESSTKKVNFTEELNFVKLNLQQKSLALLRNQNKLIPFKNKFTIYSDMDVKIDQKVRTENKVTVVKKELHLKNVQEIIANKGDKIVLLNKNCSDSILKELKTINKDKNLLVGFTNPRHFSYLKDIPNLLFYPSFADFDFTIFAQQLTSRISISGNFVGEDTLVTGIKLEKKILARTNPNFCGIDRDTLSKIAVAVNNAISGRAFPGCQVLLAKDGCIIYDRCFGKHTYVGEKQVTETSLYDLASLTKIVATTLVGMKLYELNAYNLKDSLNDYLPDSLSKHLRFPSTIRNITFQELFLHKSGLPSGFPIIRYMRYTGPEIGRYDKYYCDRPDSNFSVEVAENYFLEKEYQDSMWLKLNQIILNPTKEYNYSDVSMNTLYFMFRSIIQKSPEKYGFNQPKKQLKDKDLFMEFLYATFYKPLGMARTCYKPLKQFNKDQIVPTENETYWRKQLLQGHVHDPNAALHGGVAGNAGIFSTANDLAILCQMLLNKGIYNGQRYLTTETVDKFTARQEDSHRGLGFNKPAFGSSSFGISDNASLNTYGHTGFTGTCIWIDPDHQLTFIFLSNRVHPDVNNRIYQYGVRKHIHQIAYDAMMLKDF